MILKRMSLHELFRTHVILKGISVQKHFIRNSWLWGWPGDLRFQGPTTSGLKVSGFKSLLRLRSLVSKAWFRSDF